MPEPEEPSEDDPEDESDGPAEGDAETSGIVLVVPVPGVTAAEVMVSYMARVPKPATPTAPTATAEVSVVESFLVLLDVFMAVLLPIPIHDEYR